MRNLKKIFKHLHCIWIITSGILLIFLSGCAGQLNSNSSNTITDPPSEESVNDLNTVNNQWTETVLDEQSYASLLEEKNNIVAGYAKELSEELFASLSEQSSDQDNASIVAIIKRYYPENCDEFDIGVEYGFYAKKTENHGICYEEVWNPWAIAIGSEIHDYVSGGLSVVLNENYILFNADGNIEVKAIDGKSAKNNLIIIPLLEKVFKTTTNAKPIKNAIQYYRLKLSIADVISSDSIYQVEK